MSETSREELIDLARAAWRKAPAYRGMDHGVKWGPVVDVLRAVIEADNTTRLKQFVMDCLRYQKMELRDQVAAELLTGLGHTDECSAMWHTEACLYCGTGLEGLPHEYACDCLKRDALRITRGKERL